MNKKVITIVAVSLVVVIGVSVGIFFLTKGKDSNKNGVADKLEPQGLYAAKYSYNTIFLVYFDDENVCYGGEATDSSNLRISENTNWQKYTISKDGKNLKLEIKDSNDSVKIISLSKSFAESFVEQVDEYTTPLTFVKVDNLKAYLKGEFDLDDTSITNADVVEGFWNDYWTGK
jgi:hypothetical protein